MVDDQGTTCTLGFGGGGSDQRWDGTLSTDHALTVDTTWIELFDRRIELVDGPPETGVEIDIEPLETINPADRHLWRRVALGGGHFGDTDLEPTTAALIVSGALASDDPSIELAQRVSQGVPGVFRTTGAQGRSARRSGAMAIAVATGGPR